MIDRSCEPAACGNQSVDTSRWNHLLGVSIERPLGRDSRPNNEPDNCNGRQTDQTNNYRTQDRDSCLGDLLLVIHWYNSPVVPSISNLTNYLDICRSLSWMLLLNPSLLSSPIRSRATRLNSPSNGRSNQWSSIGECSRSMSSQTMCRLHCKGLPSRESLVY